MKSLFVIIAIAAGFTVNAQMKPAQQSKNDTLTLSATTKERFVKIGDTTFVLEKYYPGVFTIQFNAEVYNKLIDLIDNSSASNLDVKAMKVFIAQQLQNKGLLPKN